MLMQLPNGDWINPEEIESIVTLGGDPPNLPRVVVRYGRGNLAVLEFPTPDEAAKCRDELAAAANAAK